MTHQFRTNAASSNSRYDQPLLAQQHNDVLQETAQSSNSVVKRNRKETASVFSTSFFGCYCAGSAIVYRGGFNK